MLLNNISDAKANLSQLVKLAEEGQEVLIARNGKPVAKLVGYDAADQDWKPGALKGKIWIADDFDSQETNDEIARLFGMMD